NIWKRNKVDQCFHGYEEYYRIVKILKINPEKNYAKVLVDDESKYKKIIFKKIVYFGWTINDEHKGGCFGGDQTWHHRIFSDNKTDAY
ncbi:27618_t:CDS:2, partial [Gigaspora margarita]